jgi:hypothetical protein
MKRRYARRLGVLVALLAASFVALLVTLWWQWKLQQPAPSLPVAIKPVPGTASSASGPVAAAPQLPAFLQRQTRTLPAHGVGAGLAQRAILPRLALPDQPAVSLYRALLPVAEVGDDTARYALARLLADCQKLPIDTQAAEQIIDEVRRTHRYIDTAVRYPDQFANDLLRNTQHCAGLDAGQRASYHDWLVQAADDGELDALENFELFDPQGNICRQYVFEKCTPEQQANSRAARQLIAHYLIAARDAGSLNALWQLGAAYLDGELLPVDKVSAFANLLAYERASHEFGLRDPVAGMVRDLRSQLGPGDRAAAADQARAFLSNPKCCVLIE